MKQPVLAPSVGESITEVSILKWAKADGANVQAGELLLEIESDKATVEIVAETTGRLTIQKQEGEKVAIGTPIGEIDSERAGTTTDTPAPLTAEPVGPPRSAAPNAQPGPAARKRLEETKTDPASLSGTGKDGRINVGDIPTSQMNPPPPALSQAKPSVAATTSAPASPPPLAPAQPAARRSGERIVPMSSLRQKIAERLVSAQRTAAILTTFNEVDMTAVMSLRSARKEKFKATHGVNLSFMSFFTQATIQSLQEVPELNASLEGSNVVYHDYFDIGIAVGTEKGLVVPVVRDAGALGFVGIEKRIAELAQKARDRKLSIAEMSGGTFTLSNGGTYGSLLSTPILNPPQCGILGMHKIQDRAVVVEGQIVIRPMMYLALSYDHRLIDGKGAVSFLVRLKELLEHPDQLAGLEI